MSCLIRRQQFCPSHPPNLVKIYWRYSRLHVGHFVYANMFARPRPKKSLYPPPAKRRKTKSAIEEISFDFDARADYLTGFHKRKVQRAKQAQEEAAKKAKEERIAARKQVRAPSILKCQTGINNVSCVRSAARNLRRMWRLSTLF